MSPVTFFLGYVCLIIMQVWWFRNSAHPVNVSGYDLRFHGVMALNDISDGMKYGELGTGRVVILCLQQAIHLPHVSYNLLNPMQIRLNDIVVNQTPSFYT
jgi:hypothetical protein